MKIILFYFIRYAFGVNPVRYVQEKCHQPDCISIVSFFILNLSFENNFFFFLRYAFGFNPVRYVHEMYWDKTIILLKGEIEGYNMGIFNLKLFIGRDYSLIK